MVRSYRTGIWTLTLATAAGAIAAQASGTPQALPLVILAQTAGAFLLYARIRSQTRQWAVTSTPVRTASPAAEPVKLPGHWILFVLPLLICAGTAAYLNAHYESLPSHIPIHHDAFGVANRWSDKGVRSVFGPLLFAGMLQTVFLFISFAMSHGTRGAVPGGVRMRSLRANLWLLLGVQWAGALLIASISLQPLLQIVSPFSPVLILAGLLAAGVVGALIYLMKLNSEPSDEVEDTPDECWRCGGVIYYNPEDPVLMVEKRMGLGYTINFGNRLAWIFVAHIFVCALAPVWLFR